MAVEDNTRQGPSLPPFLLRQNGQVGKIEKKLTKIYAKKKFQIRVVNDTTASAAAAAAKFR